MEIRLFKYLPDETGVKPSSPKQLGVRVRSKPQPSLLSSFEVVFVSTERERETLSVQTGSLVYLYVTVCCDGTEIPLQFSSDQLVHSFSLGHKSVEIFNKLFFSFIFLYSCLFLLKLQMVP